MSPPEVLRVFPLPVRRDRRAAEETFQALPAVLLTIVIVAVVFGALGAVSDGAHEREAQARARLQAELFVESTPADPTLAAPGGAVAWEGAVTIARGTANLSFVPDHACAASLLDTQSGEEIFLYGSLDAVSPACQTADLPVPLLRADGTVVPGLLRAGVEPK